MNSTIFSSTTRSSRGAGVVLAAVSALACMLAPVAVQAASTITLYGLADGGVLHSSYKHADSGARNSGTGMASGTLHSSRIGFKGAEDLGNGLKVIFNLEQKVKITDGSIDRGFQRKAYVGFSGKNWGELTLGRQKNVADGMLKLGTVRALGKPNRVFGNDGARVDGLVKYLTPEFSGVRGGIGYARGDAGDDHRHWITTGARYDRGPLHLGAGFDQQKLRGTDYSIKNWALGASWSFPAVKVTLGYGQDRNGKIKKPGDVSSSTLGGVAPVGLGDYNSRGFRSRNYYLGAELEAGTGTLGLAWSRSSSNLARTYAAHHPGQSMHAQTQNILAAQYKYPLSKRSLLYVYGASGKGLAYVHGFKGREAGLGLLHKF